MDYEKLYKEALSRAKEWHNDQHITIGLKGNLEDIFPELKINEDERIRKEIIEFLQLSHLQFVGNRKQEKCIAWLEKQGETYTKKDVDDAYLKGICDAKRELEKQGEKNPADKVEPKFHEGEWLCENEPNNYARFIQILETVNVQGKERYRISRDIHNDEDIVEFNFVEKYYHKFDIKDARDCDVLVTKEDNRPFIFKGLLDSNNPNCPVAYCGIDSVNLFLISPGNHWWSDKEACPATKEQRDLLFSKIKEAGYEWNDNEKVLVGFDNDDEQYEELEDDETDLSIKQNPSWSEEDEKRCMWIVRLIDTARFSEIESDRMPCDRNELIKWLKSLKPQSQWKPTQEQLHCFKCVIDFYKTKVNDTIVLNLLNSLYNDLKKL